MRALFKIYIPYILNSGEGIADKEDKPELLFQLGIYSFVGFCSDRRTIVQRHSIGLRGK